MKRANLIIPLVLAFSPAIIHAQSVGPATINSAGGAGVIGTDEFEWSVGEMVLVSTFSSPGIVVTQGMLQPIVSTEGTKNTAMHVGQLQVFPNPVISEVNIKYTSRVNSVLSYRLVDMNGKLIAEQAFSVKQGVTNEKISVAELACATYMLEVTVSPENGSAEKTVFKISKIK